MRLKFLGVFAILAAASPLAAQTATPFPTATPIPTGTPIPTASPIVTATVIPSVSPAPSVTQFPTATFIPTATLIPTTSPIPTSTTIPTLTQVPTSTAIPTASPIPSGTPIPTLTPIPTTTPIGTGTLIPTATAFPTATIVPTATLIGTATAIPTITGTPIPTATLSTAIPTVTSIGGTATLTVTVTPIPTTEPTPGPFETRFTFTDGSDGWNFGSPDGFANIDSAHNSSKGSIDIITSNNTNTFGFWQSPTFGVGAVASGLASVKGAVAAEEIYRARFRVSSDVANPARVPSIRFRTSTFDFQSTSELWVFSQGDGGLSPTYSRTYEQWFVKPAGEDRFRVNFDVVNVDPNDEANARISLEQMSLELLTPVLVLKTDTKQTTPVLTLDFAAGNTNGFRTATAPPLVAPVFFDGSNGLAIAGDDAGSAEDTIFGSWTGRVDRFFETGKMYRLSFTVDTDANPENASSVPTLRFRVNDSSLQTAALTTIASEQESTLVPTTGNQRTYDLLVTSPDQIVRKQMIVSFDYLCGDQTNDNPSVTAKLSRVVVSEFGLSN